MANIRVLCGTPKDECNGHETAAGAGLGKSKKMHADHLQAFKCYAAYLVRNGYTKVGPREFASPNDGPILVLTKPQRFGAKMRPGKAGEKGAGTKAHRFVPKATGHRSVSGTVVSS